jgi:hypothetical protein
MDGCIEEREKGREGGGEGIDRQTEQELRM